MFRRVTSFLSTNRYFFFGLLAFFAFLLVFPLILSSFASPPITFNQHTIEELDRTYHIASFGERFHSYLSFYSFTLNNFFNRPQNPPLFDEQEALFGYIFASLPYYAIVYPTEMYYYYSLSLPDANISGNLRLVELPNNRLSFGYFDADNQSRLHARMIGSSEGLEIRRFSDTLYSVFYRGKTVFFRLSSTWDDMPSSISLLPQEKVITHVRDESGVFFYLLFDNTTRSFYYLLDEENPLSEPLVDLGENIFIGERTGFAFYHDISLSRKVLFGVNTYNIEGNTHFDGPFDQVYPFLDIRETIYASYPYTQLLGVDTYGNFLNLEGMRVSISPYYEYTTTSELVGLVNDCLLIENQSYFLACITYEPKRNYHLDSPSFYSNGTIRGKI